MLTKTANAHSVPETNSFQLYKDPIMQRNTMTSALFDLIGLVVVVVVVVVRVVDVGAL